MRINASSRRPPEGNRLGKTTPARTIAGDEIDAGISRVNSHLIDKFGRRHSQAGSSRRSPMDAEPPRTISTVDAKLLPITGGVALNCPHCKAWHILPGPGLAPASYHEGQYLVRISGTASAAEEKLWVGQALLRRGRPPSDPLGLFEWASAVVGQSPAPTPRTKRPVPRERRPARRADRA
jgi:hypothetical protein